MALLNPPMTVSLPKSVSGEMRTKETDARVLSVRPFGTSQFLLLNGFGEF